MIADKNDDFQVAFGFGCDRNNNNRQTKQKTVAITILEILSYLDSDSWK